MTEKPAQRETLLQDKDVLILLEITGAQKKGID